MLQARSLSGGVEQRAEAAALSRTIQSNRMRTLKRFGRNRLAIIGAAIVGLALVLAIAGPWLTPKDPVAMDLMSSFLPPSATNPFGTDDFGRDVLSRVIEGARPSLEVGLISVGIAAIAGCLIGLLGGYLGGKADLVIERVIEVMLAFPSLLLALAIIAVLGPSLLNVMIAVGIGSIPIYSRMMRGQVLALKKKEYVDSAKASGAGPARVIFRHILPNTLSPLVVLASLGIANAILTGAALSFIGMGAQPPSPEWGAMLSTGQDYLRHEWWIGTFPGLALSLTALGFNLLGDGIRDALDPRGLG